MPGVKGQMQARGVERRRAIVDAAIEHFAREGYRGTGIAAIAEQAGVTTGGLLHHFGSKEGLLVEVLRRRDQEALAAFEAMGTGSVADDFALWVDVATWNEDRQPLAALHTMLQAESIDEEHPARAYFTERNRAACERLSAMLRRGVESGELRADVDVAAKAAEIQAFVEGAVLLWLHAPERGGLARLFRSYFDDQLTLLRPSST
jgi:AcrR family transcriptional regulator